MIDMLMARKAFADYVKKYDIQNDKIRLKVEHIERVSKISKKLSMKLNLDEENIALAELIGLLHDIGRFEQIKKFNTFNDRKSVNHGELGALVLFNQKDGIIRNFIKDTQYDEIIRKAIINHNKDALDIPKDLTQQELLHTKIVRDSDKTDILYLLTYAEKETVWEKADLSDDLISDEIYKDFMEKGRIDYGKKKSSVDSLIGHFAYIFDFNFPDSIQYVKEQKYIEKIYNRFEFHNQETKEKYQKIYDKVMRYMENVK